MVDWRVEEAGFSFYIYRPPSIVTSKQFRIMFTPGGNKFPIISGLLTLLMVFIIWERQNQIVLLSSAALRAVFDIASMPVDRKVKRSV